MKNTDRVIRLAVSVATVALTLALEPASGQVGPAIGAAGKGAVLAATDIMRGAVAVAGDAVALPILLLDDRYFLVGSVFRVSVDITEDVVGNATRAFEHLGSGAFRASRMIVKRRKTLLRAKSQGDSRRQQPDGTVSGPNQLLDWPPSLQHALNGLR